MIKTSQYCFDISIGIEGSSRGMLSNFLQQNDLGYFEFSLVSGLSVPLIKCTIKCHNNNVSSSFRQGSIVKITFGPNDKHLQTYECTIGEVNDTKVLENASESIISFEAVITEKSSKFVLNTDNLAFQGTSLEALKHLSKTFFGTKLDTDITSVNETPMIWRQDSRFNNWYMADIWMHMNLKPDVPLTYIDDQLVVHLRSLNNIVKAKSKVTFVPHGTKAGENQVSINNVFNPESHIAKINAIISNQSIFIRDADTGKVEVDFPDDEKPEIASTKEIEKGGYGHSTKHNRVESTNISKGYKKAYSYNRTKLNRLSAVVGYVEVLGIYKGVNVLDLVTVSGTSPEHTGNYLVSDIVYKVGHGFPPVTIIWLCRDNINRVEKYVRKKDSDNAFTNFLSEIRKFYTMVRSLRVLVQKCRYVVDGSLYRDLQKFVHQMKYDLLRSFTVCGIPLDFNSTKELFTSLRSTGMRILNNIVTTYLPAPFNTLLLNYPGGVKTKALVSKLLTQHEQISNDVRLLIIEIQGLIFDLTDGLGRVAKKASTAQQVTEARNTVNNDNVSFTDSASGVTEVQVVEKEVQQLENIDTRVNDILQDFINNTNEIDIPLPIINLTPSEQLYTDRELRLLLANMVMTDLTNKGYLEGITNFKDILLGESQLTFEQINQINKNTGLIMYTRFWGSFNTTDELTDFYITTQFRDMYKTPDFTKLVNARKGQHIFVAFPAFEQNLRIFINSVFQDMDIIPEMNLHITDKTGNLIPYNVYVSKTGYNSNSNILEVRSSAY